MQTWARGNAEYGSLPEQGSASVSVTEGVDASGPSQSVSTRQVGSGRITTVSEDEQTIIVTERPQRVIVTVINHEVQVPRWVTGSSLPRLGPTGMSIPISG